MRGLVAFDIEFHQTPRRAIALFLGKRTAPIEIRFLEINEPVESELQG